MLIANAFCATARSDAQLLVTAATERTPIPDDARVRLIAFDRWRERADVCDHLQLCDALVCAHAGGAYLASGQVADAIGAGLPMLVGTWGYAREVMGDAAWTFDGTETGLAQLFSRLSSADIASGKTRAAALRSDCPWSSVSRRTLAFFREIVARRSSPA